MATVATFQGDVIVIGSLYASEGVTLSAGTVDNEAVEAGAGIESTKVEQERSVLTWLSNHATAATAVRYPVLRARGAGTVVEFKVGATVAADASGNAVVRLLKNGSTILSSNVTLTNATAAYAVLSGTLSATALVAGDVLEVEVVSVVATAPKGLFAQTVVRETSL